MKKKVDRSMTGLRKAKKYLFHNLYKIIIAIIGLAVFTIIIRGIFFDKNFTFAIANETSHKIDDLVIKIDNKIIYKNSIYRFAIPCCWENRILKFGFHKITVQSESMNLSKSFAVFSMKNTQIYIGVWENKQKGQWIEIKVHYILPPLYA